jgi:hypothetical protein
MLLSMMMGGQGIKWRNGKIERSGSLGNFIASYRIFKIGSFLEDGQQSSLYENFPPFLEWVADTPQFIKS